MRHIPKSFPVALLLPLIFAAIAPGGVSFGQESARSPAETAAPPPPSNPAMVMPAPSAPAPSAPVPAPAVSAPAPTPPTSPSPTGPIILIDSIHAYNAFEPLNESDRYSYHDVYGYRMAFGFLRARGFRVVEVKDGELTPERLAGVKMLFLNLPSGDLPPFRVSEIAAIKSYIEGGGSFFSICDHSNCYYHAYKLMPLFEELGMDVHTETACDVPPNTLGPGNGWICVTRFAPHPVTQGLRAVCMETAGTLDDRYAIGTTSPGGWGDMWSHHPYGFSDSVGFYGNWVKDPGERTGALAVITAKTLGQGRIVVVGDQNLFGDPFLNFADNYRLWFNAVAWLTGDPAAPSADDYVRSQGPALYAYDQFDHATFANSAPTGYNNVWEAINRNFPLFGGDDPPHDPGQGGATLLIFAHNGYHLPAPVLAGVLAHLRANRNILILGKQDVPVSPGEGMLDQIKDALGTPLVGTAQGVTAYSWAGCGHIMALEGNSLRNDSVPDPETEPKGTAKTQLDLLMELIKGLVVGT